MSGLSATGLPSNGFVYAHAQNTPQAFTAMSDEEVCVQDASEIDMKHQMDRKETGAARRLQFSGCTATMSASAATALTATAAIAAASAVASTPIAATTSLPMPPMTPQQLKICYNIFRYYKVLYTRVEKRLIECFPECIQQEKDVMALTSAEFHQSIKKKDWAILKATLKQTEFNLAESYSNIRQRTNDIVYYAKLRSLPLESLPEVPPPFDFDAHNKIKELTPYLDLYKRYIDSWEKQIAQLQLWIRLNLEIEQRSAIAMAVYKNKVILSPAQTAKKNIIVFQKSMDLLIAAENDTTLKMQDATPSTQLHQFTISFNKYLIEPNASTKAVYKMALMKDFDQFVPIFTEILSSDNVLKIRINEARQKLDFTKMQVAKLTKVAKSNEQAYASIREFQAYFPYRLEIEATVLANQKSLDESLAKVQARLIAHEAECQKLDEEHQEATKQLQNRMDALLQEYQKKIQGVDPTKELSERKKFFQDIVDAVTAFDAHFNPTQDSQ